MNNLQGKTALVTGASRGIGRASALALAQAGAQVLVHYSSSPDEADTVVTEIRKAGGKAEKVSADLSKPDGAHVLAKQVRRRGLPPGRPGRQCGCWITGDSSEVDRGSKL